MRKKIIGVLLLLYGVASALAGCGQRFVRPGQAEHQSHTVALEAASQVEVKLDNGLSDLRIGGGADDLLESDFKYNLEELRPVVDYSVSGEAGKLSVTSIQEKVDIVPVGEVTSEWDLRFNETVPLAMDVNLGMGEADLDFSRLQLAALALNGGAGQVAVQLGQQELDELVVNGGLGDLSLHIGGGRLDQLVVRSGAGDTEVDLRGDWQADADAKIEMGVGEMTLRFPREAGIRVQVSPGLGAVEADGFTQRENVYQNDRHGRAEQNFDVAVSGGIGTLVLEMED